MRWAEYIVSWGEEEGDAELLVDILGPLTNILLWQANFTRGRELLQRIRLSVEAADTLFWAEVWLSQMKIDCQWKACSQEEIKITKRVITIFREKGKDERVIHALKTLGNIYLKLRNVTEAIESYQEGLRLLEASSEKERFEMRQLYAALRANLGHAAYLEGHLERARELTAESVKDMTATTDLAEAHASLALFEYRLGHIEQAYQYRRRADRYIKQVNMARPISLEDKEWLQLQQLH